MKTITKSLIFCVFPLVSAFAQEEKPSGGAPESSLNISTSRTHEERIQFLFDVAQAYTIEKDFPAAIDAYERILEMDPMQPQARYIVAHIYISAKEYKKAETILLELTQESPEDFKLWNNLAWLYATAEDLSMRNGKKAVACAQEAMTLAPNDYHVWSTLAEAYYVSGDYEKAYRAITHMASIAARYAKDMTKESIEDFNEQILKCKRAMDTEEAMKGEEEID
jgi:tetratricopeptide (TPR) repeat protein